MSELKNQTLMQSSIIDEKMTVDNGIMMHKMTHWLRGTKINKKKILSNSEKFLKSHFSTFGGLIDHQFLKKNSWKIIEDKFFFTIIGTTSNN